MPISCDELRERARKFLAGQRLTFEDATTLWKGLEKCDDLSLARTVVRRMRKAENALLHGLQQDGDVLDELCRKEALLTSKDQELSATIRHRRALKILEERFGSLDHKRYDGDAETLGIAGGIYKRQWEDLGQYEDLLNAARSYDRGAMGDPGDDGYAHINAAFLQDLLAVQGDRPDERRARATELRKLIVQKVDPNRGWWSAASIAESQLGLGDYAAAAETMKNANALRPEEPWKVQTTARQLATLARLREKAPLDNVDIKSLLESVVPGTADAVPSWSIGKVGLALSGGGFRASFYHLGVLARLAELNVLKHVEVLSCVSGGSIAGACYWLALRRRLLESNSMAQQDYVDVVKSLITHFENGVAANVRHMVQPTRRGLLGRLLVRNEHGAIDPELTANKLDECFYLPLFPAAERSEAGTFYMDELRFTPKDHDPKITGSEQFDARKHNWMRGNKVPALVLNATTVNTGRGWQFTPTWMGESPWALNEGADNIERLEWANYNTKAGWRMRLARAVAASACVPGIFAPLKMDPSYETVDVELVDGGVYDNQGVAALLAMNCNVLMVSDASGQLRLERKAPTGLIGIAQYAQRAMDILMERVRQATYADLDARRLTGLVRGLMFQHMKEGLDADTIRLPFSQETYQIERTVLSPSGVRKEYQKALAELRTDLDAFSLDESRCLMACGYQMATHSFEEHLARKIPELAGQDRKADWVFAPDLQNIVSLDPPDNGELLKSLQEGSKLTVFS
jgi:predicted acylesterase/phospholipase RssA